MLQATALEVIMRVAFGVDGDFIQKDKLNTDKTLFKKTLEAFAGFTPKNYFEDFMWLLIMVQPSLTSMLMDSLAPSYKGNSVLNHENASFKPCNEPNL